MVSWLRIHIAAWKVNRKYDLEALNQFLITCLGMESNLQQIYVYMKPPTGLGIRLWNENWTPQSGKGDEMCYGFGLGSWPQCNNEKPPTIDVSQTSNDFWKMVCLGDPKFGMIILWFVGQIAWNCYLGKVLCISCWSMAAFALWKTDRQE
jgi:hypothetical protein